MGSFQAQRTIYAPPYGVGPYTVYDYGRIIRQQFGARAGIGLGLTHRGIAQPGEVGVYASADELRVDVLAAAAAGSSREHVGVYSFVGIYRSDQPEPWFPPPQRSTPPAAETQTAALHLTIQRLDSLGR